MLTARPVFLFYPQKSCPLTGKSGQLCSILPVPAHTLKADGKAIQTIFHPGKEGYDEKIYLYFLCVYDNDLSVWMQSIKS